MTSALLQRLTDEYAYPLLGEEDVDDFVREHGHVVLFFTGDPLRIGETADVAIILPELMKVFGDVLQPAIVARTAERPLQLRYRFSAYPALVFLDRGGYLGAISKVQDWNDYLREIARIMALEPSEPPPYRLPGCVTTGAGTNGSRSAS